MFGEKKENLSWKLWKELTTTIENLEKSHTKRISHLKLTNPQFNVLATLKFGGSMPLRSISKRLNVTGANITCVMDNLEKRNFAERIPSKNDRRIINAGLTDEGEKMFEEITPHYLESINQETSKLTDDEKIKLMELLSKLKN